jgi:hypothetical protein
MATTILMTRAMMGIEIDPGKLPDEKRASAIAAKPPPLPFGVRLTAPRPPICNLKSFISDPAQRGAFPRSVSAFPLSRFPAFRFPAFRFCHCSSAIAAKPPPMLPAFSAFHALRAFPLSRFLAFPLSRSLVYCSSAIAAKPPACMGEEPAPDKWPKVWVDPSDSDKWPKVWLTPLMTPLTNQTSAFRSRHPGLSGSAARLVAQT